MQSLSAILKSKHDMGFRIIVTVYWFILFSGWRVSASNLSPHGQDLSSWKCVPVKLDFCKDVEYNMTINMNIESKNKYTDLSSQEDSGKELGPWKNLIKINCSQHLRLLLCSVYLPFCTTKVPKPITACRFLCEEVKSKCYPTMQAYGIPWPDKLNCTRFPEQNGINGMCLGGGLSPTNPTIKTNPPKQKTPNLSIKVIHKKITSRQTYCKVLYTKNVENYFFVEKIQACALECMKDGLFTYEEKRTAEKWVSALSCICCFLCILSLVTVIFNYQETRYPERCVIFITICYLWFSLAYVVRVVISREEITCQEENGRQYLLVDGSGNVSCAATFLLVYCFSMIQSIWWVILSLTWFLTAGMKWTGEAIKSRSWLFHVCAWGIPCVKTVIVLIWRKIDVNELTGICSIGNRYENLAALRWLKLAPLFIYFVMGTMFLLFGLITLFRLPAHRRDHLPKRSKIKLFLLPIGVYAAIHTLFLTFILASYFYEYVNKNAWYNDPTSAGPNFNVFLIRIISEFGIGITAALWMLTVHAPRIYSRLKVKHYHTDLLIQKGPERTSLDPDKVHHVGTNETSI